MTLIEWFRNEFISKCSDLTIASLIFLYNKYNKELLDNVDSREYIRQLCDEYSKPMKTDEEDCAPVDLG